MTATGVRPIVDDLIASPGTPSPAPDLDRSERRNLGSRGRHLAEATLSARLADLAGAKLLLEERQRFQWQTAGS